MNITTTKRSVDVWKDVRHTPMALTFLTSGTGFSINRFEYNKWLDIVLSGGTVDHVYVYLSVMEFEMAFWLVDSFTDAQAVQAIEQGGHVDLADFYKISENTFLKWFTKPLGFPVTVPAKGGIPDLDLPQTEALSRNLRWNLYSNVWFHQKQLSSDTYGEVVQVFKIPFSDLDLLFGEPLLESVDVLFALKDFDPFGICNTGPDVVQDVELILSSRPAVETMTKVFADVTCPCPPFCNGQKFGLLLS